MNQIHPTAIVHHKAILGNGVIVGPYAIIGPEVMIGDNTEVMAHSIIDGRTQIGKNNRIYPSASIGLVCQDLKYKGEPTKLIIGDYNQIREFSTIHLSATLEENTVIGNHNLIMAYAHVAHNCQLGNNIIIANAVQLAGHVHVHDYVTIGGLCAVHQFVKIGTHAFIGGASGLSKDVPPYTRGQGMIKYRIAGLNTVGLSRRGFTSDQIVAIKQVYRILFDPRVNIAQALEKMEEINNLTPEQQIFYHFCKTSQRGISRVCSVGDD